MKRQFKGLVLCLLAISVSIACGPRVVFAQVPLTSVQLTDDFYRIRPEEPATLDITANDSLPEGGWKIEIGQPSNQGTQFSLGYGYFQSVLKIYISLPPMQSGYYIYHYFLTWQDIRIGATVNVIVTNKDGTDPSPPTPPPSPLSPLFLPLLRGE